MLKRQRQREVKSIVGCCRGLNGGKGEATQNTKTRLHYHLMEVVSPTVFLVATFSIQKLSMVVANCGNQTTSIPTPPSLPATTVPTSIVVVSTARLISAIPTTPAPKAAMSWTLVLVEGLALEATLNRLVECWRNALWEVVPLIVEVIGVIRYCRGIRRRRRERSTEVRWWRRWDASWVKRH